MATRGGLRLSPDSITYLSVADHVRHGRGLTDFTGDPLTVFGPVHPLLLAPGGRSEMWARLVGAACVAGAVLLMHRLLRSRARPLVALAGAGALGASAILVLVASSAFSEVSYILLSLAVLVVLDRAGGQGRPTARRVAVAGALAGLGFLTRYAGASLVVTGAVMIAAAMGGASRAERVRAVVTNVGVACAVSGVWVVRNLAITGQPLGPRFEGGTTERWSLLLRRPFIATGQVVLGESVSERSATAAGVIVVALLGVAAVVWFRSRPVDVVRIGVIVFAATNFVLPVVARALTSNDVSARVMSPLLVPIVFTAAVAVDAVARWRIGAAAAVLVVGLWLWQGVTMARDVPDLASSGSRTLYSPRLHDLIDGLAGDAQLLTNNPWGVWWQNEREPTLFAFTRPRAGNSHFPISAERTLELACSRATYLAWFPALRNAGDGPVERRPDLLDVVRLDLEDEVPGGELYRVRPLDDEQCPVSG